MIYEKITESEWQIMRVLWEDSPKTSAQIIKQMSSINNWSPTTIKTFISRLIDKKVVGFHEVNKKRAYYTLITEKDCVINEMKSTIQMIYGGKINHLTKHFEFYGNNDIDFINQLSSTIETDYESLIQHFHYEFKDTQSIYLHSSQNRFFSAMGMNLAPSWVRAGIMWEILHLSPKETFIEKSPNKLLHHILTILMINSINPNTSFWLQQGISAYESKWLSYDDINQTITENKHKLDNLNLSEFSDHYLSFKEGSGHEFAYTFVDFIVKNYGYTKLNDLIRKPHEINIIFNQTLESLEKKWRVFIKNEYLEGNINEK